MTFLLLSAGLQFHPLTYTYSPNAHDGVRLPSSRGHLWEGSVSLGKESELWKSESWLSHYWILLKIKMS